MAPRFRWITEWTFDAPVQKVWDVLSDASLYPSWWPGFEQVVAVSGDGGVGAVTDHRVNVGAGLRLRFRMTVTARRPPEHVAMTVAGDSVGVTEWRLRALGPDRTAVTHVWDVTLARRALRLTGMLPGAGRFFERRHRATMAKGRANLERLLTE